MPKLHSKLYNNIKYAIAVDPWHFAFSIQRRCHEPELQKLFLPKKNSKTFLRAHILPYNCYQFVVFRWNFRWFRSRYATITVIIKENIFSRSYCRWSNLFPWISTEFDSNSCVLNWNHGVAKWINGIESDNSEKLCSSLKSSIVRISE